MGGDLRLCDSNSSKHNSSRVCVSLSFALYISMRSVSALAAGIDPAESELILLTEENLNTYTQKEDGKTRFKTTDEASPRHYVITTSLDLDDLELNNRDTRLTLDMQHSGAGSVPSLFINNIQVAEGCLDITAAATQKKAANQSQQISNANSEFSGSAVKFSETSSEALPILHQTGGLITISAQDNMIAMDGANAYQIDGGKFYVTSRNNATALYLDYSDIATGIHNGADVLFSQTNGQSIFIAENKSTILNSNQSVELSGGLMQIDATDDAKAIILHDSNTGFQQKDGTISIKADKESTGLQTSKFIISGGSLYLQSGGHGKAIHLIHNQAENDVENQIAEGGQFLLKGGLVQISQNDKNPGGYAIYGDAGSNASFAASSVLRPILDANHQGTPITGLMSFGSVQIDPQAKFSIGVANTATLQKDTPLTLRFLESRDTPINGNFIDSTSGEKLFFKYELEKSADGKSYQLRLSPKSKPDDKETEEGKDNTGTGENNDENRKEEDLPNPNLRVSDILHGNNQRAVIAIEKALSSADAQTKKTDNFQVLNNLYDTLYNSNLGEEEQIKSRLRRLIPHQATRLPALSLDAQRRFSRASHSELLSFYDSERLGLQQRSTAQNSALPNLYDYDQNHAIWLMPVESHSHYHSKNSDFTSLNANYSGLNFGAEHRFNEGILNFSAEWDSGRLRNGQIYNTDRRHAFIGGGYARHLLWTTKLSPVLAITASYGNSYYKQTRRDSFDQSAKAQIRQNSFLTEAVFSQYYQLTDYNLQLVPQIGLDYAYLHQNNWSEKGGRLPLQVKMADYHSLRAKLGGMMVWNRENNINLNAYAYHHYATLNKNINLRTRLRDASAVMWQTKGENINRSAANLGVKISHQLSPNLLLDGGYDIFLREKQTEQGVSAQAKLIF